MALARNTTQRNGREAEKPERISKVRNAMETTTMAAAASVSVDKPLTDRQKLFAKFHAEGDSIPNAMQRAGYNEQPSYGYRLVKMPNVQREIAKYQEQFRAASELSKKDVMDMLKESFDMAKLMSEPSSMVSAAREIGKLCGYYEPKKIDINVAVGGRIQYEQLSDADLFRMIEEAAQQAAAAEAAETAEEGAEDALEAPLKRLK
jgi:hypothetical protein